jgi:hypothetical protein
MAASTTFGNFEMAVFAALAGFFVVFVAVRAVEVFAMQATFQNTNGVP